MRSFSLILSAMAGVGAVSFPDPSGPHPVAMRVQSMTDKSRIDPYSPENDRQKRKVMTSLFWPIDDKKSCTVKQVAYMPPATAEVYGQQAAAMGLSNETFAELTMGLCDIASIKGCSKSKDAQYPLAVFSPGSGNSRLIYGNMARSLASRGYVIVTVDHPYDAAVVEFPDGSVIETANIPEEGDALIKLTKIRADDLSFVVSQLENTSRRSSLLKGLPGKIDFDNIVVYGHSLGGSSAAVALLSDSRLRGGANLDGRFVEPALSKGPKQPFLLLGRPNHRAEDATWATFWKNLRGPKTELALAGTVHGSFTDVPLIVTALGLPAEVKAQISSTIGTIDAQRLEKVLMKILSSFFTYTSEGKNTPFFKAVKAISELSIVNSKLPDRS
ncbi:Alpha/Beta hydrolase protein [Ilyonectria robusta]|uniref:Alpha/Beta hydrolase protein n=1 Tax=Ilyonectria robusta TaxID=1079257 RepID=UPI001E8E8C1F|nr:Alpha/Beta hydrolase protein [Ilyonectria robusta]KAH8706186.1 Alpha/Beta hydrolase protein [Ilyonectria robusta]